MSEFEAIDDISKIEESFARDPVNPEISKNIDAVNTDVTNKLKEIDPNSAVEFRGKIDGEKIVYSLRSGPTTIEINVEGKNYGEAILDPKISSEAVVDSFVKSCEKVGLSIDEGTQKSMKQSIDSNSSRDLERPKQQAEAGAVSVDKVASDPDIKKAVEEKSSDKFEEAKGKNPQMEELGKKLDKISEKLKDPEAQKSLKENLKEGAWDVTKTLAFLVAGVFTYEAITAYQNTLRGCFQSESDGKTVTRGKIGDLTCDSCCNTTGDLVALGTDCDKTAKQPINSCTCLGDKSSCGNSCDSAHGDSGICSVWCNNSLRVTKNNSKTYSYSCNNPSFFDAIADIAGNADKAISDLFDETKSFFANLLKYGLIGLIGVGVLILLYLAYKFISSLFEGKPANTGKFY